MISSSAVENRKLGKPREGDEELEGEFVLRRSFLSSKKEEKIHKLEQLKLLGTLQDKNRICHMK